ncbi:MAG: glutathione S-transferase [Caulobacterales bacterium]
MAYELHYWPGIQGRGEFVRLALEYAGADYADVARGESGARGLIDLMRRGEPPPFAPPILRDGELLIAQTANILLYLGPRLGLAPADEAGRLWVNQLQLTIADIVDEAHDTHHPISSGLYYEDQKPEALRRAAAFREARIPKYHGYFERILAAGGAEAGLAGAAVTYADLSLFQLVRGLQYAFPMAMQGLGPKLPHVLALADRVARHPSLAAYLASPRRIAFNEEGIFRRYPELDG